MSRTDEVFAKIPPAERALAHLDLAMRSLTRVSELSGTELTDLQRELLAAQSALARARRRLEAETPR
jgi:hypothetical protein